MKNIKKRKGIKSFFRAFALTMILSVCSMALLAGIMVADQNTRELATAKKTAAIEMRMENKILKVDFLGNSYSADISFVDTAKTKSQKAVVLIPAEIRMSVIALRQIPTAISEFIKRYL
ncbi:MAG: hypothetical protein BGN88_03015 [Clostridiales bacterium 43-6]|nr:MAG: hypothetical protein BGN88_03015 [Clostridiales bacterium 43-6]